jgi:hypothetical protein
MICTCRLLLPNQSNAQDSFVEVENDVLWLYGRAWDALDRYVNL